MLTATDLTVRWGAVTAVDGVSITVGKAEMVALVGPNGAGKTSLIQALAGQVRPAGGTVTIDGRVGYVPEGRQLFYDMSVEDNLALGAWRGRNRDPRRVYEMLPDLAPLGQRRAGTLSGGQQQMVAVGRALMADPEILLIDELSLGLAPVVASGMVGHLSQLHQELGVAVLLIEQNVRIAMALCPRAYVLENGRIAGSGSFAELAASDDIRQAYLGNAGILSSSGDKDGSPGALGPESAGDAA